MAIADLASYQNRLDDPVPYGFNIVSATSILGRLMDGWMFKTPAPVAAPTTAAVPDRTSGGSLGQLDAAIGTLAAIGGHVNLLNPGFVMWADRLSHSGGLSGIVTTAQTTNLPTAALTRQTSGEGVWLGLTIYTQVGTTATTVTASYTNQDGTAGRTTIATVFGGTNHREAARMIVLPLQSGDTGVRSVQSVTVLATTGTAGNFGVTLFKPVCVMLAHEQNAYTDGLTGGFQPIAAEVVDGAALFPLLQVAGTNFAAAGNIVLTEH